MADNATLKIKNDGVEWFWPTADGALPGAVLITDAAGNLTFGFNRGLGDVDGDTFIDLEGAGDSDTINMGLGDNTGGNYTVGNNFRYNQTELTIAAPDATVAGLLGAPVTISAGDGDPAGDFTLNSGDAVGAGLGGDFTINAGDASTNTAGSVSINSGQAVSGNGGDWSAAAGLGATGGDVNITSGEGTVLSSGSINLTIPNSVSGYDQTGVFLAREANTRIRGLNASVGSNNDGVDIELLAGVGDGTGNGGNITLRPGTGTAFGAINLSTASAIAGETVELRFLELAGGSEYVGFKAPDAITANVMWTLPAVDAAVSGEALLSDAAGNLFWGSPPAGAANQIIDADGNTWVRVELTADDNIVRVRAHSDTNYNVALEQIRLAEGFLNIIMPGGAAGTNTTGARFDTITGTGDGTGGGGDFTVNAGNTGPTAAGGTFGGIIDMMAGDAFGAASGGDVLLRAGNANGTGDAGPAGLRGGSSNGGMGGNAELLAGDSVTATGGDINISSGVGAAHGDINLDTPGGAPNTGTINLTTGDSTGGLAGGLTLTRGGDPSYDLTDVFSANVSATVIRGPNAAAASANDGLNVRILAGDGDGVGNGGSINLRPGNGTAMGEVNIANTGTAAGETTELRFQELSSNGTDYVGFKAPDSITAGNVVWTLPATDTPFAGLHLSSDGAGNLFWGASVAIADTDQDTYIAVEATPDDDTIRMGVGDTITGYASNDLIRLSNSMVTIQGNDAAAASGNTGVPVEIRGGTGEGVGLGADVTIFGGEGGATGSGGNIILEPGTGNGGAVGGSVHLVPNGAGTGETTELRFYELTASGTDYVGFKAADALAAPVMWTLPNAEGNAGEFLRTDGAGVLDWGNTNQLVDVDSDTFIQVEAGGPDTDTIQMQIGDNTGGDYAVGPVLQFNQSGMLIFAPDALTGGTDAIDMQLGAGDGAGAFTGGGNITLAAGDELAIGAGNGGGNATLAAGDSVGGTGGAANLVAGDGTDGGSVNLQPGGQSAGSIGAINLLNAPGAGAGETTELRFRELNSFGNDYIGFKAPDSVPTAITFTLPIGDGSVNQHLTTNASGVLSWSYGRTLQDADADTFVFVELTPDDDTIRIRANGSSTQYSVTQDQINITEGLISVVAPDGAGGTGGDGAFINITAGAGDGAGQGGDFTIAAGDAGANAGDAGILQLRAGSGGTIAGDGGDLLLDAGTATQGSGGQVGMFAGNGGNGQGGQANLEAGDGTSAGGNTFVRAGDITDTAGNGGRVDIEGGNAGSVGGTGGDINLVGGTSAVGSPGAVVLNGRAAANGGTLGLRFEDEAGGQYAEIRGPATIPANYSMTLPESLGNTGSALIDVGSGKLAWGQPHLDHITEVVATGTVAVGELIPCNTSGGSPCTVTVPTSPAAYDRFAVVDSRGTAFSRNITVAFTVAGDNFHGQAVDDVINEDFGYAEYEYVNATIGWIRQK